MFIAIDMGLKYSICLGYICKYIEKLFSECFFGTILCITFDSCSCFFPKFGSFGSISFILSKDYVV